jgi:hypothetical protein
MKPGDLIEWMYESDSQPVHKGTRLWSRPMNRWIAIDVYPAVLVSITDEFYSWLMPDGLFNACVDDRMTWNSLLSNVNGKFCYCQMRVVISDD